MSRINKIKQYSVEVKNISPLRVGNGEEEGTGLLINDKHAVINGTTLAGVFRDFLKKSLGNDDTYKLVFPDNLNKEISKIFFYDSVSEEEIQKEDLCCRNHVKIDKEMGCSLEKHLFNEYHISEGKTFKLFFEIRGLNLEEDLYNCLCNYLEEFIKKLSLGQVSIGSKTSFGFGKFKVAQSDDNIKYKEYDLLKEVSLTEYLNFDFENDFIESFEKLDNTKNNLDNYENDQVLKITLEAYCEEGFIIKSNSIMDDNNISNSDQEKHLIDSTYKEIINGETQYIIPASTIKGVVRGYCNKIIETLGKDYKTAINDMFGLKADNSEATKGVIKEETNGKKGMLIFEDCKIKENDLVKANYNRIKIDRFTGGAIPGAILKEELAIIPIDYKAIELCVSLNVPLNQNVDKLLALIILVFRDLGLGRLTIGSGNNVGYGRFKGKEITLSGAGYNHKIEFKETATEANSALIEFKGNVDKFEEIIKTL